MSIAELSPRLTPDDKGIWTTSGTGPLSYPADGNRDYFLIEDRSLWFRHRNDCIMSMLKVFPSAGPVLDVGGGNGFVTRRMLDEGIEAVLLEPGMEGAFNGRMGRDIPEVICATLECAGFPGSSLSAVGLFDVIEHIESDCSFVDLVHYLLVPGGLVYAAVPAHSWLWSSSDEAAGHFRRYSRKSAEALFEPGFDILYMTGLFGTLALPMLLLRVLPYRLGLSKILGTPSAESEHGAGGSRAAALMYRLLKSELSAIRQGKYRHSGTSLLFVARKTSGRY
jgi:hypothetical protein